MEKMKEVYSLYLEMCLKVLDQMEGNSKIKLDFKSSYKHNIETQEITFGFSDLYMFITNPSIIQYPSIEYTIDALGDNLKIMHYLENVKDYIFSDRVYLLSDEKRKDIKTFMDTLDKSSYESSPDKWKENMNLIVNYLKSLGE